MSFLFQRAVSLDDTKVFTTKNTKGAKDMGQNNATAQEPKSLLMSLGSESLKYALVAFFVVFVPFVVDPFCHIKAKTNGERRIQSR